MPTPQAVPWVMEPRGTCLAGTLPVGSLFLHSSQPPPPRLPTVLNKV